MESLRRDAAAQEEQLRLAEVRKPPACWAWHVTDADRGEAQRIRDCVDVGEAHTAAMKLLRTWQGRW